MRHFGEVQQKRATSPEAQILLSETIDPSKSEVVPEAVASPTASGESSSTGEDLLYAEGFAVAELLDDEQPGFWGPVIVPLMAVIGGDVTDAFVRIMILRRMCSHEEKVYWTREEILQELPFIIESRLISALSRLRRFEIIRGVETLQHMRLIEVTPAGKAVLSALQVLRSFGNDEELRFAYVVSQLAASTAAGTVSEEVIDVVLTTINAMVKRATEALQHRSERLIEQAHDELQVEWRWLEQAGDLLEKLASDPQMSGPVHRKAQQTGRVLAQAQQIDSVLKRFGAEIAGERERITKSGLTARMLREWVRTLDVEALCDVASGNTRVVAMPMWLNHQNALEVAQAILDRERAWDAAPPPLPPRPTGSADVRDGERPVDNLEFLAFVETLRALEGETPLEQLALVPENFESTALRIASLVRAEGSSLATRETAKEAVFRGLNLSLQWTKPIQVNGAGVSRMTGGAVTPHGKGRKA